MQSLRVPTKQHEVMADIVTSTAQLFDDARRSFLSYSTLWRVNILRIRCRDLIVVFLEEKNSPNESTKGSMSRFTTSRGTSSAFQGQKDEKLTRSEVQGVDRQSLHFLQEQLAHGRTPVKGSNMQWSHLVRRPRLGIGTGSDKVRSDIGLVSCTINKDDL